MSESRKLSRRSFLRGRFFGGDREAGAAPAEPDPTETGPAQSAVRYPIAQTVVATGPARQRPSVRGPIPLLRPPGAIEEREFLQSCTKAGACVSACPHDTLILAPERFRSAAGTPTFDPSAQPCWFCEDAPCIAACESGALSNAVEPRMGTARIVEQTCLAHQGTFCSTCREQCPVEGAIVVTAGRPVVDEDVCVGCGVCQYVCPAPQNPVLMMPMFRRPSPESDSHE